MPDLIKLLPDSVANQIAAGEVIQRPASVIKELMENSVDANAENIIAIVKDSGKTLIQVIDDGTGMSETDARLSFERHATSKITSANDLFAIKTKGFRGEALASIAAVSMVELKTCKGGNETGTFILVEGSRVKAQEPCSCIKGSSLAVKNLFFNTPARRKFLKSDNTEMRHIITEFQKIAIAHPEIKFSLIHNDNDIYNLPPSSCKQRIIAIFGKQINNDLINLETETSFVSIRGFIGKPENARRTYGEQFFFVNNRFMKHPYFHKAVIEAYHNILPPDAIPSYYIFMETDPASIDINIHPTKTEIKFEDERSVWQILSVSVREALGRFNIVPSIDFNNEILIDIPVRSDSRDFPEPPEIRINTQYNPFAGEKNRETERNFTETTRGKSVEGWEKLYRSAEIENSDTPRIDTDRKIFQIRGKYIVCPVKSGLMIIDQKRAHERILFEKYIDILKSNPFTSQSEMFPLSIKLNPADYYILKEIDEELRSLGFNISYSEKATISVSGRPLACLSSDLSEFIEIMLEEFKNTQAGPYQGMKENVVMAFAAASAIPYGKVLQKCEMEDLFDNLFACKSPNYSPGGKPVISIIKLDEIDKRFRQL